MWRLALIGLAVVAAVIVGMVFIAVADLFQGTALAVVRTVDQVATTMLHLLIVIWAIVFISLLAVIFAHLILNLSADGLVFGISVMFALLESLREWRALGP